MPSDEEIHNALVGIHNRLGSVEGKVNLVARAIGPELLPALKDAVAKAPLMGQIYLVLDGKRSQRQLLTVVAATGVTTSKQALSRWLGRMETEHGIAELVKPGVYRRDLQMERILNLSRKTRKWLADADEVVPRLEVGRRGPPS